MKQRLKIAQEAIIEAGDYLKNNFYKRHTVEIKQDKTEILKEDVDSEEIIITTLKNYFPNDSFFTEERETKISSGLVWIIDPICGTYSYLRGVETWSLSIALIKDGTDYLIGVVYQPLLDNIFYSVKGGGAFKNKTTIKPSQIKDIDRSFISVEHAVFNSGKVDILKLIKDCKRIRVGHGSGAELSYVAAGYLDVVIKTGQSLTHFAGGRSIIEEAGGVFVNHKGEVVPTYFDKNKKIDYIATNKFLKQKLVSYFI